MEIQLEIRKLEAKNALAKYHKSRLDLKLVSFFLFFYDDIQIHL